MDFPADDPRTHAREIIRSSIDPALWERNEAFTHKLAASIRRHRLFSHRIVEAWKRYEFSLPSMAVAHLEIKIALAETFTDSLIRLMQTTSQLERRLGLKAKMAARFLLQLNVLEELGFKPTPAGRNGFSGHPGYAHYWQLGETLAALGLPESKWQEYTPSPIALVVRDWLPTLYDDHLRLATALAVIETVFIPYYDSWARNTIAVCPTDISGGYHTIHVEDGDGVVVDDAHSEDSWFIIRQALTPDRYEELEVLTTQALDLWSEFMDMLVEKNRQFIAAGKAAPPTSLGPQV